MRGSTLSGIHSLVYQCRYEKDVDRQVEILHQINKHLPHYLQLKLPSFFTDDYVRTALDVIEEKIFGR
jgi:hypothetical protein